MIAADGPDGVRTLTLNRPQARNALATPLLVEVADALDAAASDERVRCAVVTGGPEIFAAGADINEIAGKDALAALADPRAAVWARIRAFPKPLLAAVEGLCLGGGHELALCADIVVAGAGAKFGQPEINLGIIPGAGGTQMIPRIAGKSVAMKMILAGEWLSAEEARACGLCAEVVESGKALARAHELAAKVAQKSPLALRLAKEAVLRAYETALAEGLAQERKSFALLCGSADKREGIAAFKEKRAPQFKGR
ncbi:MAG: enoyl-CoA hydratase/isomerase family protein [Alphaproteobacteria bacterium]|nr:enoyl-CoA hydratase/isomerase family protein [Alphaproteobacteria bacterium]